MKIVLASLALSVAACNDAVDIREVGRRLDADLVIQGSVRKAGDQLRIAAQAIQTESGHHLWSETFRRELKDVFAIQEEISRGIVNGLRLNLGRGRRRYETSTEAYDLYLRARALGPAGGVAEFEQAIAKDPSFAPAWAGLAAVHGYRSGLFSLDPAVEVPKLKEAADRALELDPMNNNARGRLAQLESQYRRPSR